MVGLGGYGEEDEERGRAVGGENIQEQEVEVVTRKDLSFKVESGLDQVGHAFCSRCPSLTSHGPAPVLLHSSARGKSYSLFSLSSLLSCFSSQRGHRQLLGGVTAHAGQLEWLLSIQQVLHGF